MNNKKELSYKELKMVCNKDMFHFETTQDLESVNDGIGQERGIKALQFGLQVDVKGYNIYIEGPSGVGKTMYTKNYLDSIAPKKKVPNDWCYIYNFQNPNEPIAVSLPAGQGKEFKESMDGFIQEVKKDIKKTFNADDFEKEKKLIKQEFEAQREVVMQKLTQDAFKEGFQVKSAQNGIYMMPIVEGKVIEEEEFEKLEESVKQHYEEKSTVVQQQIMEAIGQIKQIEREVDLSGSTHSKGVYILSGYLGELFAQDIPLCLTASICFEQLYNGVDGDSASSTELYGLLSSLSEIPIKQSIAVTGSVNQKGQIQPIGGVNEKIEGYFQICKMRGLDGSHGVMIPVQNVENLQLNDDVVEAVKNNLFHIYAVSTIDEGIEVLTGVPAGKKDKDGKFPAGTVNYLAYEKLKKYAKICEK